MKAHERTPQDEVDRAEWENPANWSDSVVGMYFGKKDSRVWVPKRVPTWGWTINLGHPAGAWWLVAFLAVPPIAAVVIGRRQAGRRSAEREPGGF